MFKRTFREVCGHTIVCAVCQTQQAPHFDATNLEQLRAFPATNDIDSTLLACLYALFYAPYSGINSAF